MTMRVRFAGEDLELVDVIARCLEVNYTRFGFADDGEAALIVAKRLLSVLDGLGCEVRRKAPISAETTERK